MGHFPSEEHLIEINNEIKGFLNTTIKPAYQNYKLIPEKGVFLKELLIIKRRYRVKLSFYNWTQRGSFDDIRSCHASS